MTKIILTTLISLTALAYSPASARTDLDDDWTDFPSSRAYKQQERLTPPSQYAARTECEVPSPSSTTPSVSAAAKQPNLLERIREALLKSECKTVRIEKNEIICEDYSRCTKEETTDLDCEYCPSSMTVCIEGQMRERWRFNPNTIGKVEGLLIDMQYLKGTYSPISLGYALRPVGKNELFPFQYESTTKEVRGLINSSKMVNEGKK